MGVVVDYSVSDLVPVEIEPFGSVGFERDGFSMTIVLCNGGCLRLVRIVDHNVFTSFRIAGDFGFNVR